MSTLHLRRARRAALGLAALALLYPHPVTAQQPEPASSAPPGATARCRDGTYSFSRHRSGTCSHHGGVAVWLSGGGASTGSRTSPRIDVGPTGLLTARAKTSGRRRGPEPHRRCPPGAHSAR